MTKDGYSIPALEAPDFSRLPHSVISLPKELGGIIYRFIKNQDITLSSRRPSRSSRSRLVFEHALRQQSAEHRHGDHLLRLAVIHSLFVVVNADGETEASARSFWDELGHLQRRNY